MTDASGALVSALAVVLLRFLWQGALIGLLAWLGLGLLRNARPQLRYAAACGALACCVLVPVWQIGTLLADPAPSALGLPTAPTDIALQVLPPGLVSLHAGASAPPSTGSSAVIVMVWSLGAALLALRMAGGLWWVRRLRAGAVPADATEWKALQELLDRIAPRLGVVREVRLLVTSGGGGPLAAGWIRPVVLFPAALALRLPGPMIEALVAHELAHIRRHDYLVNLLQSLIEVVLFYHPVVWWLSRQIREERELIADRLAAEALGDSRPLARALLEIDRETHSGAALAQSAHGGHLMTRIQQLLAPRRRPVATAIALPLLGLGLASFALYANALLPGDTPAAPALPAVPAVPSLPALPAVPARPATAARVADPLAPFDPVAPPAPVQIAMVAPRMRVSVLKDGDGSFGMVRQDRDGILMSGQLDDAETLQALRRVIPDDFLWYRRDGQAFVIRDSAVLSRAAEIWKPADALDRKMRALDAQMRPHQAEVERIQAQMQQLDAHAMAAEPPAQAASALQTLGVKQQELARGRMKLERALQAAANDRSREEIRRDLERLDSDQRMLDALMRQQSSAVSQDADRVRTHRAPREGLQRDIEVATRPMQQIGRAMEVLGREIERTAGDAKAETLQLIDRAERQGLAQPAPR